MFDDIRQKSEWKSIERISKGWSADEKYYIRTREGKSLLLRCSDIGKYEAKKKEYEMIKRCSQLGFLMSAPVDFGICNQGKENPFSSSGTGGYSPGYKKGKEISSAFQV